MATVDLMGVRVSSPQEVREIAGSKITFADGGWCDVYNFALKSEGKMIETRPLEPEEDTFREFGRSFDANEVMLCRIPTKCTRFMDGGATKVVSVVVQGPKSLVDQLTIGVIDGVLILDLREKASRAIDGNDVAEATRMMPAFSVEITIPRGMLVRNYPFGMIAQR